MITFENALVFDTETTNLPHNSKPAGDSCQPHVVQLGAMLIDRDNRVRAEMNLIIKPDGNWQMGEEALKAHGITVEMAEKYGVSAKGAASLFSRLLAQADVVVAHNFKFDRFLIHIMAARCGLPAQDFTMNHSFCTMENSRSIVKCPPTQKMKDKGMGGYKNPSLQEAHVHFFGREFEGAHDAMADVRACRDIFWRLVNGEEAA